MMLLMSTYARCSMTRKELFSQLAKVVCAIPCMICSDPFVSISRSKCNLSIEASYDQFIGVN